MKPANCRQRSRMVTFTGVATCFAFFACSGTMTWQKGIALSPGGGAARAETGEERAASAAAFLKASRVLFHPRCLNCHPAGDRPLVGDDSRPHPMHVERGAQGMGKNGLLCSTCHREKNPQGDNMPPGAPEWQLPPADMPMVFEKMTPRQLCEQLKDPARNGSRSPDEVLDHVREAPLVLWGWHPGDGRTPVNSMSHEEFVKLMAEWVDKGAACP